MSGRPSRIAMVAACPFPHPRGTPIRIHGLANVLGRRGNEVHVVTYHLGSEVASAAYRLHRIREVPLYRRMAPGPTYGKLLVLDPLLVWRLRAILRERAFDVVHAHHYEGLLVALAAARGRLPIVFDAHTTLETELEFYPLGMPRALNRRIGRALDRRLPGLASHTVAVSERIAGRLVDLGAVRADEVTVVPTGTELERFDVPREARPRDRPPTIVFTGNLAPYQGIDLLLHAFRRVRERRPDARLRLVTDSRFDPYEGLAAELGIRDGIDLADGGVDELPAHLAGADVVVNPRVEAAGVPIKLLNYMAAGKPIVSFAGSGEGLEHGRTGILVPGGDVDAFAAEIVGILERPDHGESLGDAARATVREGYGWDESAVRVEDVYARVTGRR